MTNSPAKILAQHMISGGTLGDPGASSLSWPLYVGHMPDQTGVPDNAAAIYDVEGLKDGRLMEGTTIFHYGVQVRIRSRTFDAGWTKIQAVATAADAIKQAQVVIGGNTYTIAGVSQVGPALFLGLEGGTKRRFLFTINMMATIKEV